MDPRIVINSLALKMNDFIFLVIFLNDIWQSELSAIGDSMFGRKQKCPKCNNKTSKKHDFCPFCGFCFKEKDEFFEPSFNFGFPFNAIIKQLEKQIEHQMKEADKEMRAPTFQDDISEAPKPKIRQDGISISISSSGGQPVIRVSNLGQDRLNNSRRAALPQAQNVRHTNVKENIPKNTLTEEQAEKFSKLPKHEPSANVRRMSDKIIYEIDLPDVEEKNVHITKLQNSIEIKAFAKDKAFFKLIPISLPILNSHVKDGKLVLELKPTN